jgi:hypothetical protein
MSMENHGGMMSKQETPDSSATALWQSYQQSNLVARQEKLATEMILFYELSLSYSAGNFNMS